MLDFDQLVLAFRFLFLLKLFTSRRLFLKRRLFGLDYPDAHLAELCQNVLDLLGIGLFRSKQRINLVAGDITALVGGLDQLLDGRVGKIE